MKKPSHWSNEDFTAVMKTMNELDNNTLARIDMLTSPGYHDDGQPIGVRILAVIGGFGVGALALAAVGGANDLFWGAGLVGSIAAVAVWAAAALIGVVSVFIAVAIGIFGID